MKHKSLFTSITLLSIFLIQSIVVNAQYWEKDLPKGAGFYFETDSNTFYNVLSETSGPTTTFTICHITQYGDSIRSFTATDTNFAVSANIIEQLADSSFIIAGSTGNYAYVSRIDYNGNLLWYDTLLANSPSMYHDLQMINNSEFILVGQNGDFWSTPYGLAVKFNINGTRGWVKSNGSNLIRHQIEPWTDSTFIMMSGWSWAYFEEIDTAGNITLEYVAGRWASRCGFFNDNGTIVYRGEEYFSLRSAAASMHKTSDGAGTLDFNINWVTTPSTESYLSHHEYSYDSTEYITVGNLHQFNGALNGSLGDFMNGFFVKMDTNGVIDYTKNYTGELWWCREINPGCYLIHMDNKLIMDCCGGNPIPIDTTNTSICQGDSTLIYGTYQSVAGTFYDTLQNILGCDSFYHVTVLTVNLAFNSNQNDTICQGDSILIYGTYQSTSGTYYDSLQTTNGCDSILSTTLFVNPSFFSNQNINICDGDSVLIFGTYQDTTGIYYDSLTTEFGCDSVFAVNLTVSPTFYLTDTVGICVGDSLFVGGAYQYNSGDYYDTLVTTMGCDSIIATNLTFSGDSSNSISGTIYYLGAPITSGWVKLIHKTGNSPQTMVTIDSIPVNPNGTYQFNGLISGSYLIKAWGDTSLYSIVSTYADSTNHWQWATEYDINLNCNDSIFNADVYLIYFPATIGFGKIAGTVTNGATFLPYEKVDIALELLPNGTIKNGDLTDSNGEFEFKNIETGYYTIHADIQGYKMDTVNFFDFSTQNNVTYTVEICLDTTNDTITYCSILITSIMENNKNDNISIYPNPTQDKIAITRAWNIEQSIDLKLYDMTSKLVLKETISENQKSIELNLSKFKQGIYQLHLSLPDGSTQIRKIIKH